MDIEIIPEFSCTLQQPYKVFFHQLREVLLDEVDNEYLLLIFGSRMDASIFFPFLRRHRLVCSVIAQGFVGERRNERRKQTVRGCMRGPHIRDAPRETSVYGMAWHVRGACKGYSYATTPFFFLSPSFFFFRLTLTTSTSPPTGVISSATPADPADPFASSPSSVYSSNLEVLDDLETV